MGKKHASQYANFGWLLDKLTLREGMQIMLQYERDTRGNNRIQRLIKNYYCPLNILS